MFQHPKHTLDPIAPPPPTDQWRCAPLRLLAQERVAILVRFVDAHYGHLAIGRAGGPQPHVADVWLPGVLPPRPPLPLDEGLPFDLAPIRQGKDIGLFALYEQRTLVRVPNMVHELRVAKPTIGDDQRRRQCQATSREGCQPLVEPQPRPRQFVPAGHSRPYRSGRRMTTSTGTTKRPSPMTTTTKRPSMPVSTRLC